MDPLPSRTTGEASGSKSHPRPRRGVVRVIGKIRSFVDSEIAGTPTGENPCLSSRSQISISRPDGEQPSIVLGDQAASRRDSYKLDWCYGQDEGADQIFSREVKPLLQGVLRGSNACVIAYGTPGSGKTQMIQGSEDNPGLAPMAISEILLSAVDTRCSVAVSCYEVCQDRVYDMLEPKEKEVLVLEDAGRRIQLKGLSLVPVKSITDFNKLYFQECNQRKSPPKVVNDAVVRSHRGLIVHVTCIDKETNNTLVGKLNFVDLAGFEDSKKNSNGRPLLTESAKVNKSLYALLNVVYALNNEEMYVPYREHKLTRMLQDSLHKANGVLITCLKPNICQDSISALSLACRSCQAVTQQKNESAKSNKSCTGFAPPSSPINGGFRKINASVSKHENSQLGSVEKKESGTPSMTKRRPQPLCNSVRRSAASLYASAEKKVNDTLSTTKGRKLLNAGSPVTKSLQCPTFKNFLNVRSPIKNSIQNFNQPNSATTVNAHEGGYDCLGNTGVGQAVDAELSIDQDDSNTIKSETQNPLISACGSPPQDDSNTIKNETQDPLTSACGSPPQDDSNTIKNETQNPLISACGSPPLSERLREISDSLKFLSTKPVSICTPQVDASCTRQSSMELMESRTPGVPVCSRLDDSSKFENTGTPLDLSKGKNTGLKKYLVDECLAFLNNASKEELKQLKGIGEKRAEYILKLRENNPEPFKEIDNIRDLGISSKQLKEMMAGIIGDF